MQEAPSDTPASKNCSPSEAFVDENETRTNYTTEDDTDSFPDFLKSTVNRLRDSVHEALFSTPKKNGTNGTAVGNNAVTVVRDVSSADYIRLRTQRLDKEMKELIERNHARRNRLQSMRGRSRSTRDVVRNQHNGAQASDCPLGKSDELQLPDLYKCFEEARERYLAEAETKRCGAGVARLPRTASGEESQRGVMSNLDTFGRRFFDKACMRSAAKREKKCN
ncbi:hypothetical protein ERJ75_001003800 [Trypanosoma vivax]|uniref:Uncharacterized protein n=1 Tax=Trypanosoma vivax (strain Y486) TaxID=1055687 RepID=G0UB10_TRYVY|nr:hypothetical protein ERJ75_001003800 [Trypanosoma vivax]CCC52997.1 conserved hypothetical protein [Trypanosoma vivax Y486]